MTQADIKYVKAIENLNEFLHGSKDGSKLPSHSLITSKFHPSRFEDYYKELQGLKGFFDTVDWDRIVRESGETWIADLRQDAAFKEYYRLRSEIDRLEVLVK